MTVAALYKLCGQLIKDGHGRKPVLVDKSSFEHPLEADGAVVLPVKSGKAYWVPTTDDDGGTKENKDGTEAGVRAFVLSGGAQ